MGLSALEVPDLREVQQIAVLVSGCSARGDLL